jgi:nucleoside-diphosphate-sugar epimerase
MRIFVTGATGFIGSRVVEQLIGAGHQVIGLCRSEEKAPELAVAGAEVHMGSIYDPDSLTAGVAKADAVIHLAFNHDFSTFAQNCEDDRRVIETLGSALIGSNRPLLITSGTMMANTVPGELAREGSPVVSAAVHPRAASEETANAMAAKGVNVGVVRLPQVHDTARQGLVIVLVQTALEKRVLAYPGEGQNRWPAAHVLDVAHLYRLAIEKAQPGAVYHAVAEEGVTVREISETLSRRLKLPTRSLTPEEVPAHFGWFSMFAGFDAPASSDLTRKRLGWKPVERGMIADLEEYDGHGM